MWIAFRTSRSNPNGIGQDYDEGDHYEVVQTPEQADALLKKWQEDPATVCAGTAQIINATEPHWLDD